MRNNQGQWQRLNWLSEEVNPSLFSSSSAVDSSWWIILSNHVGIFQGGKTTVWQRTIIKTIGLRTSAAPHMSIAKSWPLILIREKNWPSYKTFYMFRWVPGKNDRFYPTAHTKKKEPCLWISNNLNDFRPSESANPLYPSYPFPCRNIVLKRLARVRIPRQ